VDDYLLGLDGVYPHADYVTVNISSPNTKNLRALQSDERWTRCCQRCCAAPPAGRQHGRQVPMFVKIAPDLDEAQVGVIAATLRHNGMDGVIATNTTIARDAVAGPAACRRGRRPERRAGVRGQQPRDRAAARRAGQRLSHHRRGRRAERRDAQAKLAAGADLVQIYTGLIYRGPALVRLTSPGTPCTAGPSMRKSAAGSPGPLILGRMPA
jgi:dihydroorotate dehydrogenase